MYIHFYLSKSCYQKKEQVIPAAKLTLIWNTRHRLKHFQLPPTRNFKTNSLCSSIIDDLRVLIMLVSPKYICFAYLIYYLISSSMFYFKSVYKNISILKSSLPQAKKEGKRGPGDHSLSVSLLELQVSQFSTRETLQFTGPQKGKSIFLSTWPNLVTQKTKQKFFSSLVFRLRVILSSGSCTHTVIMQENFWKSSVIFAWNSPVATGENLGMKFTPEIHFCCSSGEAWRRRTEEATGEGFLGSPMSTQVMPGPLTKHGRPHRQSLIKLSELDHTVAPISNPVVLSSESQRQGFKETILLPYLPSSAPKHEKQRRLP